MSRSHQESCIFAVGLLKSMESCGTAFGVDIANTKAIAAINIERFIITRCVLIVLHQLLTL